MIRAVRTSPSYRLTLVGMSETLALPPTDDLAEVERRLTMPPVDEVLHPESRKADR